MHGGALCVGEYEQTAKNELVKKCGITYNDDGSIWIAQYDLAIIHAEIGVADFNQETTDNDTVTNVVEGHDKPVASSTALPNIFE